MSVNKYTLFMHNMQLLLLYELNRIPLYSLAFCTYYTYNLRCIIHFLCINMLLHIQKKGSIL